MVKGQFGVAGLGVMGQNVALNIERNGFPIVAYNRGADRADQMRQTSAGKKIQVSQSINEFVKQLERPRCILLMITAGKGTDAVIGQLKPLLEPGDVIIDGGNAHFSDTDRRQVELNGSGIHFIGSGISGGEKGALWGPSIMPGGDKKAYKVVEPVLTKIAAQTVDGSCCAYMGAGSAGHYVKMVHNGIEYGIMQIICEVYDVLRKSAGMAAPEIRDVFGEWAQTEISSFLLDITVECFGKKDADTGRSLVDLVFDVAGQKGTGKWTAQSALDLGVPIPTLSLAVEARILSGLKGERMEASKIFKAPKATFTGKRETLISALFSALYLGKVACYAQGLALIKVASKEYNYGVDLGEVTRIWKAGCIIRSKLLDPITKAYRTKKELPNLMCNRYFRGIVNRNMHGLRSVMATAGKTGVPATCLGGTLAYVDSYRSEFLPANLLQALRDNFGSHTYKRLDREGVFHSEWDQQ